tara:strand:- start:1 stop:111 length:111 start_codon:yes stop_codon:yes gene_type:complete
MRWRQLSELAIIGLNDSTAIRFFCKIGQSAKTGFLR